MKCEICGEEAIYRFSPDLDINGLEACEKHKQDMQIAYVILLTDGEKACKSFLNSLEKTEAHFNSPSGL